MFSGRYTAGQISRKARNNGVCKSQAYRQAHGIDANGRMVANNKPWNKGIRFQAGGRAVLTQFKPGSSPPNKRMVGETRITKDGYIEIKTEEGKDKFKLLHRENWKKEHGQYPPPGTALIFKDGDKTNCDVSNLQLVTRQELMQMNSVHRLPEELKQVIAMKVG